MVSENTVLVIGAIAAILPLIVIIVLQSTNAKRIRAMLEGRIANLENELQKVKEKAENDIEEARRELTIEAYPFEFQEGENGWVVDNRIAEVGYEYQLFIRGIPCFEPHRVVTKRVKQKDVNHEKLTHLRTEVSGLLEGIASRHPAFSYVKKVLR